MEPSNIVLLGVKGAVLAFRRDTGAHLWATELKSGAANFVTVISDEDRVYAHTGGELFCLDLQSGTRLWHDGLKGFGFGLASIALAGAVSASPTAEQLRQTEASAQVATDSSSLSA